MSKVLVLSNGHSLEFTDESTIYELITVYNSFGEVDALVAEITTENLIGATFDGEEVENVVAVRATAEDDGHGNIVVHFYNRFKTPEELMQEQITELQEALAEFAG